MPNSNTSSSAQRIDKRLRRIPPSAGSISGIIRNPAANPQNRRGVTMIFAMFLIASLTILIAFALEMEHLSIARIELQRSADAAALGACWQLFDDTVVGKTHYELSQSIQHSASLLAAANVIANESPQLSDQLHDVQLGSYNMLDGSFASTTDAALTNAVRINLRRQASINGEVPLFFSKLLGRDSQPLQTSATAAMFSQISGFHMPAAGAANLQILPFALDLETWEDVINGRTQDIFHASGTSVTSGSDGLYECNLFPQGTGSPGNRGTVDISGPNNSTAVLSRQIIHGISREDMIAFGRPLEFDEQGELLLNGNTGISAAVKDELAAIIGQKRIIPIFTSVSGNGNNAWFTIVRFEGVRILEVKLTGAMNQKRLIVQPTTTLARGAIYSPSAIQGSNTLFTPVMLVE